MLTFPNVLRHFNFHRHTFGLVRRSLGNTVPFLCQKLDEKFLRDSKTLEELWRNNRGFEDISKFLFNCFSREKDCYNFTLNLIQRIIQADTMNSKDMSFTIAMAFDNWLEQNVVKIPLTVDIKQKALDLVVHVRDKELLAILSKVYKFKEDSKILKNYIEILSDKGKLEDACFCVILLNLQTEFPLEKILLPLIYRNKTGFILKYLQNHPDLQLQIAKKLDAMLEGKLESFKSDRIPYECKNICKSLSSIVQVFHIPLELCPNIQEIKINSSMNFLIRKRLENSIQEESWISMIKSLLKDNSKFQNKLIKKLIFHKDFLMASKLAKDFNITVEDMPSSLTENSDKNMETAIPVEKPRKTFFEFLSLDRTRVDVQIIQNKDDYYNCLKDIQQNYNMVGFDSEWKAQLGFSNMRLSLIQLAVTDKVYILDMLALDQCLIPKDWNALMDCLFTNPNILKLGCGLTQDIQMLIDDYKGVPGRKLVFSHFIDMAVLFEKLQTLYQIEMRDFHNDPPGMKGLSKLCQIILDKPLNKNERICDWEIRPLSDSQLTYAALDAHCQLHMFENLKERANLVSFDFDNAVKIAIDVTVGLSKIALGSKRSYRWERQSQSFSFQPSIKVNDFKVVLEKDFASLGKKLRMFGVDVTILDDLKSYDDIIKMIKCDNKIFLVSNDISEEILNILPEDKYYILDKNIKLDEKCIAHIFKKFNVHMSSNAILSRCMSCNQDEFLIIPCVDLKKMSLATVEKDNLSQNELFSYEDRSVSSSGKIDNGVQIKFDDIPPNVFSEVDTFKVCQNCGKVHYQR